MTSADTGVGVEVMMRISHPSMLTLFNINSKYLVDTW